VKAEQQLTPATATYRRMNLGLSLPQAEAALKEFGSPLGENDPGRLVRTDVPVGHPEVRPWRPHSVRVLILAFLLTARCVRTRVVLAIAS
jgi:hypothetical protein